MTIEMTAPGAEAEAPPVGLTAYVAGEIRAYLGRHSISKSELARRLGVDDTWVGKRLNGRTEITLTDLEKVAAALRTQPTVFLPRDWGLIASSPERQPIDPLAPRIVAVGGEKRRTGPVRAQRVRRTGFTSLRPLTPALV